MTIKKVLETCLYVDDLEKAEKFYSEVLGFKLHSKEEGRHIFYTLDEQMLLLFNPETTLEEQILPAHGTKGNGHVAFEVDESELDSWRKTLKEKSINIEHEHEWPNGVKSIYFRDPANNSLEIAAGSMWGFGG